MDLVVRPPHGHVDLAVAHLVNDPPLGTRLRHVRQEAIASRAVIRQRVYWGQQWSAQDWSSTLPGPRPSSPCASAVLPSQLVVRHMKERGSGAIVHIASKSGVVGEPGHAAYSASKGAIIALARAMAVELAPYAIRVNAVCPGPVMTDMLLAAVPSEAGRQQLAETAPLGRVGRPPDIGRGCPVFGFL